MVDHLPDRIVESSVGLPQGDPAGEIYDSDVSALAG